MIPILSAKEAYTQSLQNNEAIKKVLLVAVDKIKIATGLGKFAINIAHAVNKNYSYQHLEQAREFLTNEGYVVKVVREASYTEVNIVHEDWNISWWNPNGKEA